MSTTPKQHADRFPVLGDYCTKRPATSIPWAAIEPHRARAEGNHYQTLERLAERGGLSPCELLCAVQNKPLPWGVPKAAIEQLTAEGLAFIEEANRA